MTLLSVSALETFTSCCYWECSMLSSLFIYLLKQQRARTASYRLLKRETNKHCNFGMFRAPDSTQINQFGKCSELGDWQKTERYSAFFQLSWVESGALNWPLDSTKTAVSAVTAMARRQTLHQMRGNTDRPHRRRATCRVCQSGDSAPIPFP